MRGQLIWFNREKQYGYIRTEEGERLLVEQAEFPGLDELGNRRAGAALTFERECPPDAAPRAVRVMLAVESVPRRARLRHR